MAASSEIPAVSVSCDVRQTHDHALVQRAFGAMSAEARDFLWERLQFESRYEAGEMPDRHSRTGQQLLWHELLNAAHPTAGTFFVVHDYGDGECEPVFVSADWNSAHAFARIRLARARREYPGLSQRAEGVVSGTVKKGPTIVISGGD